MKKEGGWGVVPGRLKHLNDGFGSDIWQNQLSPRDRKMRQSQARAQTQDTDLDSQKREVGQGGLAPIGAGRGTRTGRRRHRSWARGSRLRRKLCCSLHSFIIVFVCLPVSLALCNVNFSRFRHWSAILGVLWFNINFENKKLSRILFYSDPNTSSWYITLFTTYVIDIGSDKHKLLQQIRLWGNPTTILCFMKGLFTLEVMKQLS